MANPEILTPKRLKKMRHARLGFKFKVIFIFWTFLGSLVTVLLAILTFAKIEGEEIDSGMLYTFIAFASFTGIGFLGLCLPKTYNKTWIDALNEKMYHETFGVSPLSKKPEISKDILLQEKIEKQTVEEVDLRKAFSYSGGYDVLLVNIDTTREIGWSTDQDVIGSSMKVQTSSSSDLGKVELRRSFPVLFQGTYLRLKSSRFSFTHRIEIRERRDSISPSSFYTEGAILDSLSFGDFDVYADDFEYAKGFLTEERKKVLMEVASTMSRGLVLIVLPKALIFEIYGVKCDAGAIPLNAVEPTLYYEEKKRNISPFLPLISTFLRNE